MRDAVDQINCLLPIIKHNTLPKLRKFYGTVQCKFGRKDGTRHRCCWLHWQQPCEASLRLVSEVEPQGR